MKKTSKRDKINLLFSAFLVIAFVVCGYFFSTLAQTLAYPWSTVVSMLIFVLFGLVLFYATRVGEGKQTVRFSLASLILVVLPTLYIILASLISQLPLYEQLAQNPTIVTLACVALGYGLPYTFISGFELNNEEETEAETEESEEEENIEETSAENNEEETVEEASAEEEAPVEETTKETAVEEEATEESPVEE